MSLLSTESIRDKAQEAYDGEGWAIVSKIVQNLTSQTIDKPESRNQVISELIKRGKESMKDYGRALLEVKDDTRYSQVDHLQKRAGFKLHQSAYFLSSAHTLTDKNDEDTRSSIARELDKIPAIYSKLGCGYKDVPFAPSMSTLLRPLEKHSPKLFAQHFGHD